MTKCIVCDGNAEVLGPWGILVWYKCQDCGMEFHKERKGKQSNYLEREDFYDVLHDYMIMAEDFAQDDDDVVDYRQELERRGCLFEVDGVPYEPEDDEDWYLFKWSPHNRRHFFADRHPSSASHERNG